MDNANRGYSEDRLHMSSDNMRFAIDNGEDEHYADVSLQEAIVRADDPAELNNIPLLTAMTKNTLPRTLLTCHPPSDPCLLLNMR